MSSSLTAVEACGSWVIYTQGLQKTVDTCFCHFLKVKILCENIIHTNIIHTNIIWVKILFIIETDYIKYWVC